MNSVLVLSLLFFSLTALGEQPIDIVPPKDSPPQNDATKKIDTDSHWGAAFATGWIADYPGAGQGRVRYLVMPTYKGKYITIDRQDGVKGELVSENSFKFGMSFIFLFPTASDKIPVRKGMPDLDWTFQLGPELKIYLLRSFYHTMFIRLPFRFVATTDFSHDFVYRNWLFSPGIRNVFYLGKGGGEITTRLDFEYASERYNDVFHQVEPQYAMPTRPAFDAKQGLLQYIVGANYSYYDSFPWTFFVGGNAYFTDMSINHRSPLIVKTTTYSVLGGVIRYF